MLTSEKIINKLYELNHGEFIFSCIGKEEDFIKTYVSFKKYQLALNNKKNGMSRNRLRWDKVLRYRYENFIRNVKLHRVC